MKAMKAMQTKTMKKAMKTAMKKKTMKKAMKAQSMKAMKTAMKTKTPGPRNIMQELEAVGLDGYCLRPEKAVFLREICNSMQRLRHYMH